MYVIILSCLKIKIHLLKKVGGCQPKAPQLIFLLCPGISRDSPIKGGNQLLAPIFQNFLLVFLLYANFQEKNTFAISYLYSTWLSYVLFKKLTAILETSEKKFSVQRLPFQCAPIARCYSLFVFIPHMVIWHLRDYCTILERKISHRVFTVRDLITEMVTGSRKRLKLSVCSLKDQALMDCSPSAILKLLDTYFREVTSHTQKSFVESLPFRK